MSFTKDLKEAKHNFPNSSRIFEVGQAYGIVEKVSDHWVAGAKHFFETGLNDLMKATFSVEFFKGDTIRLKYYRFGEDERFEQHLNKLPEQKVAFMENASAYEFELENHFLKIQKRDFDIVVTTKKGKRVASLYKRPGYEFFGGYLAPPLGFKSVGHGTTWPFLSLDLQTNESVYGLGEKFRPLERRGLSSETISQSTNIVNTTDVSYASIPLVYSTNGYAVLVNTGFKCHFDIGSFATDALSIMPEEGVMDLFIFLAPTVKELIGRYTELTGRIENIPAKAHGTMVSRMYYNTAAEIRKELALAKNANFTVDIIGVDPKWLKNRYTKTCNFEWNEAAFGKPRAFFREMKNVGVDILLWVNPNVQVDDSDYYVECVKKDFLVKDKDGQAVCAEIGPALQQNMARAIDFTNPKAYAFYKAKISELVKLGARFITADYGGAEPAYALLANGRSGAEMKNYAQWLFPKAVYEGVREVLGKGNTLIYRRPGYIGTHRFAGKWGGDSFARFQELHNQLRAGLSMALCGEVMWGLDLGGGYRGKPNEELTIRWNQAGALMPLTRYHGIGLREPWHTSELAVKNSSKYLGLKRSLLVYYKTHEQKAIETGLPILKPLCLNYQNDALARKIDDQFLIGDDILVAPVIVEGATERQVYFPLGDDWVDFENKEKTYRGGTSVVVTAELERLPIFVRKGTVLPFIDRPAYDLDRAEKEEIVLRQFGKGERTGEFLFQINGVVKKLAYSAAKGKVSWREKKR